MSNGTFEDVRRLLAQGGLAPGEPDETRYDPTLDPEGATRLAGWLAERTKLLHPAAVVIWEEPEDMILAHLVAQQLDIHWIRCFEQDGFVTVSGAIRSGDHVVFLTDALREQTPLEAIRRAIELRGAKVVGTCVLLSTPRLKECGPEFGLKIALTDS